MLRQRLLARVGDVGHVGTARLDGYRLGFSKSSVDGSGKCTLLRESGEHGVWGVVYELGDEQKLLLDGFEGAGYEVENVGLHTGAEKIAAFTYIGRRRTLDNSLRPFTWYKSLVLSGALQAGLPVHYIAGIESVLAIEDPDHTRASEHLRLITTSL